jgi:AcrR family transcriptional regulator
MPDAIATPSTGAPAAMRSRAPRVDNRLPRILDAAARLIRQHGYQAATMREIAAAAGMLAGSLYYHFASKEELLVAVYAEGVRRISVPVAEVLALGLEPWAALEAACAAHLEALLQESDYAQVVIRVQPADVPEAADRLVALRDDYERVFAKALLGLPLNRRTDRRALKLMLMGALNWAQTWWRPGGDSPRVIARKFVQLLRHQLEP